MSAAIISGKAVAAKVCGNLQNKVKELAACGVVPGLAVILVGSDPASQIYVNAKARKCAELGIRSFKYVLPEDTSMAALLELIEKLNAAPEVDGILVQFPPPPQISEEAVISAIDPRKDVDCFHERNVGKLLIGKEDGFKPCTPYGILLLLEYSGIDPKGKHAVIVGRSNIVGKPLAALLMQKTKGADATVTVAHSGTRDLAAVTRSADILIVAVGRPNFVTADMVKPGAVVIDVGINRVPNGTDKPKLVGDVDFNAVAPMASAITPVPGGVGPMTIAVLMHNTVTAARRRAGERV